jgi:hypothetical protein
VRGREQFPAWVGPRPRTPNQVAAAVTALAVIGVAAWSARPLDGRVVQRLTTGADEMPLLAPMQVPVLYEGFGEVESWGRWTIDDVAAVTFGRPLPEQLAVVVRAHAYGPNVGRPVLLCLGGECQPVSFGPSPTDAQVSFGSNSSRARRLEIHVPEPTAPGDHDPRRLGLLIESIEVRAA